MGVAKNKKWRYPDTVAVLILIVWLVAAFPGVLFSGQTLQAGPGLSGVLPAPPDAVVPPYMDHSSAFIDEPLARLGAKMVARGELPLWNDYCALGQPLLGNMQSALLSPFRWPLLLTSSPLAYDLVLLFRLFVAALLALLLARELGLGSMAATLTGVAFSLTGYFVLHANMHHLAVEVMAPGVILCVLRLVDRPGLGRGILLAFATWAAWVGGNPEATIFVAILALAFLFQRARLHVDPWRRIGWACLFAVLGSFLAGPYLLPGIEHLAHGQHHHTGLTGLDHYQPWTAVVLAFPSYFSAAGGGILPWAPPWFGGVIMLLALAGFFAGPRSGFPRKTLGVLALVLLLKAFGCPGLNEVGRLPLFAMLIFYKYGLPAIALCLALLAGKGWEDLWEKRLAPGLILGITTGLLVFGLGLHFWCQSRIGEIPLLANLKLSGSPWLEAGWLLLVAALLYGWHRLHIPSFVITLVLILGLAQLLVLVPRTRPDRVDALVPAPFVKTLQAEKARGVPVRTLALGDSIFRPGTGIPLYPMTKGVLSPNYSAAFEISDIRINDAIINGRFGRFATVAVDGRMQGGVLEPGLFPPFSSASLPLVEFFVVKWFHHQALAEQKELWRDRVLVDFARGNQVMDALGVTHLLVIEPDELAGQRVRENPARWEMSGRPGGVTIYRNKLCPGRAYLPRQVKAAPGEVEALKYVKENRSFLRQQVVVEGAPDSWVGPQPAGAGDQVLSRLSARGTLEITVETAAPRVLVIAETWYPGRVVTIDGKEVMAAPANLCLTAVQVPAGKHEVRVSLTHGSFKLGLVLAGLALLVTLALLWCSRRQKVPAQ